MRLERSPRSRVPPTFVRHPKIHVRAYNFQIEISGVPVGVARQVLGLDGVPNSGPGTGGVIAARSPVTVAGTGARFGGQYYVSPVTHTIGGNSSAAPGATLVPSQLKVIVLGMRPTDHRGANELSVWWGQKTSPQLGRRSVAIVQRDPTGRELRRYSMDGWLVIWQGRPFCRAVLIRLRRLRESRSRQQICG